MLVGALTLAPRGLAGGGTCWRERGLREKSRPGRPRVRGSRAFADFPSARAKGSEEPAKHKINSGC